MKQKTRNLVIFGYVLSLILLVLILYVTNLTHDYIGEYRAKRTVEKYLKYQKKGEAYIKGSDLLSYEVDRRKRICSFNILDYKYLNTIAKRRDVLFIRDITYDNDQYEKFHKSHHQNLKEFLDYQQKAHESFNEVDIRRGEQPKYILTRTEDSLIVSWGDTKNEYLFLYDVTLTNRLGMALHKRFTFIVDDDGYKPKYQIVDFDYDGLSDELE